MKSLKLVLLPNVAIRFPFVVEGWITGHGETMNGLPGRAGFNGLDRYYNPARYLNTLQGDVRIIRASCEVPDVSTVSVSCVCRQ